MTLPFSLPFSGGKYDIKSSKKYHNMDHKDATVLKWPLSVWKLNVFFADFHHRLRSRRRSTVCVGGGGGGSPLMRHTCAQRRLRQVGWVAFVSIILNQWRCKTSSDANHSTWVPVSSDLPPGPQHTAAHSPRVARSNWYLCVTQTSRCR